MGEKIELNLEDRAALGKAVKALRQQGYVPAVVYGKDFETRSVMALAAAMTKTYREAGRHHPVELNMAGQKRLAMIKAADIDPVKHTLRHLEFHVIKQNEKVATEVPIVITDAGETPAEKAGLVVLTTLETISIEALPSNLPDELQAPGERLVEVGDHLTIADVQVPQGVTITAEPDQVIATVYEPSALQAANEAAGGDEPEEETGVASEEGGETAEDTQARESRPGGKKQSEDKGE